MEPSAARTRYEHNSHNRPHALSIPVHYFRSIASSFSSHAHQCTPPEVRSESPQPRAARSLPPQPRAALSLRPQTPHSAAPAVRSPQPPAVDWRRWLLQPLREPVWPPPTDNAGAPLALLIDTSSEAAAAAPRRPVRISYSRAACECAQVVVLQSGGRIWCHMQMYSERRQCWQGAAVTLARFISQPQQSSAGRSVQCGFVRKVFFYSLPTYYIK